MLCPKCQAEVPDGAAFCPTCGAPIEQPEPPAAGDDFAARQAAYEAELAEYQWKRAAYEQELAAQQAPPATAPAPQPKKRRTGLVVGIIALVAVLLCACVAGSVLAARALWGSVPLIGQQHDDDVDDEIGPDSLPPVPTSAEEALQAQLDADGIGDWVYEIYDEGDGYVVYWAGPPSSEWVTQYRVEQDTDGSWYVGDIADIGAEGVGDPAGEAEQAVWEYLTAVYEDRGLDAQAWTVPPFSADSASAQISAGGLTDFGLGETYAQEDGSYRVQTTQTWYGATENWQYWVVSTEAGYRIADVQPW